MVLVLAPHYAWFTARGTKMLPAEPSYAPPLSEYITRLENILEECRAGTADRSAEANGHILRIVISLLGIYRAWGLTAQFGSLLQHPQVVEMCGDKPIRFPLILGAAHAYEAVILREFCGLDVITLGLDAKVDATKLNAYGTDYDVEAEYQWTQAYRREVAAGFVLIRDLGIPFPV